MMGLLLTCQTAPYKFLANADIMLYVELPSSGLTGKHAKLTRDIWETFNNNKQSSMNFTVKMMLWKQLNAYIKTEFPYYGLFMGGSTLSGFGLKDSDVDMSFLNNFSSLCGKEHAIFELSRLLRYLRKYESIDNMKLIEALVPVVNFHESQYDLNVDINYNMTINIRNTYLLYCYSRIDWRVRPLVIVIKLWAKSQDINNPRYGTISSYALILMVIHFLQCGVKPAILPCLQKIFPYKFQADCKIESINFFEQLNIPSNAVSPCNQQTLGELLIEFFKYYDSFEYHNYAISVRLGEKIPRYIYVQQRFYKENRVRWQSMCIEEPFILSNVSKVYDPTVLYMIKEVIRKTCEKLNSNYDLSSIVSCTRNT